MIRNKKKRVAVVVKNPFKELALPFEGRRMLIRAEDLRGEQSDLQVGGIGSSEDDSESGSSLSQEPDIIYGNYENRSSKTAKSNAMLCDGERHKFNVRTSTVLNENPYSRKAKSCNWLTGDNSLMKLSHAGVNKNNTDKTLEICRKMQKVYSRQKRSNSKQTCTISETKSNEETMSQKIQHSKCSQDDSCWDSDGESLPKGETHLGTSNIRLKQHDAQQPYCQNINKPVLVQNSDLREASNEFHDEEQRSINNLESRSCIGNWKAKPEANKAIPYQIQMNVTPEARTQRYNVRRVKHCMDGDSSKYSYIIHVSCESEGDQLGTEAEAQKSTKKRRGDIAKHGIFIKESSKAESSFENQDQNFECVSTEGNTSGFHTLSDSFRCRRSRDQTNEASVLEYQRRSDKSVNASAFCNDEISQQRKKSKDTSNKAKVAGRLIDHLQRKELVKEESELQSVPPLDNTDLPAAEATQRKDETSQNVLRPCGRRRTSRDECYHIKQTESGIIVSRPNIQGKTTRARENGQMILCGAKQTAVLMDTRTEYNEKDKLTPMDDNETFSRDFAVENVNENRKTLRDIPDSKLTASPDLGCQHIHADTADSEAEMNNSQENQEAQKENCCYFQTNTNQKWKEKTSAGVLEGKRKAGIKCDFGRYCKGKSIIKDNQGSVQSTKNGSASLTSSVRVKSVENMFKGISRPEVTDPFETSTSTLVETIPYSFNCSIEHSNKTDTERYETFATKETSQFAYTESPEHTISCVKSITPYGCKNQSSLESDSSNSRNSFEASPLNTDNKSNNRAFPQMSSSPVIQRHSPAMNIALQNENHSNRIRVNREGSLFPGGSTKRKRHRSKVPRFRAMTPEPDLSGETTFLELSRVLQDARANSTIKCTAEQLHGGAHSPDSMAAIEACINSSFMGEYLRCLWNNQYLCDVRVVVGDEEILVHKLVLAAYSNMFCPPTPRPAPTVSFQISNSSPEAVRQIFAYMYTHNMAITEDILEPVLVAATAMGVQEVVDVVKGILSNPTMENVNRYSQIIKNVGLDISLLDQEKIYRQGFGDLRHNSVFLGICVDELEGILTDPEVMVINEAETVEMIISWIQYNYLQRIGYLDLLLRYVSFECIPPADLVMLSEKYSHIFDTNAGNAFLCQAFKYHALNCGVTTPFAQETESIFGPTPRTSMSDFAQAETYRAPAVAGQPTAGQPTAGQPMVGQPAEKVFTAAGGLKTMKATLWGQQMPTEPSQFVSSERAGVPDNRSPQTVARTPQRSPTTYTPQRSPTAYKGTQSAPSTPRVSDQLMFPRPRYLSSRPTSPARSMGFTSSGATSPATVMRNAPISSRPTTPIQVSYTPASSRPTSPGQSRTHSDGRTTPTGIIRTPRSSVAYRTGQLMTPGTLTPRQSRVTFDKKFFNSSQNPSEDKYQRRPNSSSFISRNNNATDEAIRFFLKEVANFKPIDTKTGARKGRDWNVAQDGSKYRRNTFSESTGTMKDKKFCPLRPGRHKSRLPKHFVYKLAGVGTGNKHETPDAYVAERHLMSEKGTDRELGRACGNFVSFSADNREVVQDIVEGSEVSHDSASTKNIVHVIESHGDVDRCVHIYRDIAQCSGDYMEVAPDTVAHRVVDHGTGAKRNGDRGNITIREVAQSTVEDRHVDRRIAKSVVGLDTSTAIKDDCLTFTNRAAAKCTETYRDFEEGVQDSTSTSHLSFTSEDYLANDGPNKLKISEFPAVLPFSLKEYVNAKSSELFISNCLRQGNVNDNKHTSTDQSNSLDTAGSDKHESKATRLQKQCTPDQCLRNYMSFDKKTNETSLCLLNHDEELSAFEVYKPNYIK